LRRRPAARHRPAENTEMDGPGASRKPTGAGGQAGGASLGGGKAARTIQLNLHDPHGRDKKVPPVLSRGGSTSEIPSDFSQDAQAEPGGASHFFLALIRLLL